MHWGSNWAIGDLPPPRFGRADWRHRTRLLKNARGCFWATPSACTNALRSRCHLFAFGSPCLAFGTHWAGRGMAFCVSTAPLGRPRLGLAFQSSSGRERQWRHRTTAVVSYKTAPDQGSRRTQRNSLQVPQQGQTGNGAEKTHAAPASNTEELQRRAPLETLPLQCAARHPAPATARFLQPQASR